MPTNRWRHLTSSSLTQVAQVKTITITGTGGGTAVWTLTLTDDTGDTHTVSYTEDGSPSTTEVATGLYAAWEASTNPNISRITATNPSAGVVVLSAATAGIPFTVALADNGSGTHTETATTASVGYNDFQHAANWSGNEIPDLYDDVVFEAGNVHALYRSNYSATQIAGFYVEPECKSNFGRVEFGEYKYLRIAPTAFDYRGNGQTCLFDIGSAAISPYIEAHGTPGATRIPTVLLKGSAISTLEIKSGLVGLAYLPGETSTATDINIGSEAQQGAFTSLLEVWIGSGVTLTTLIASSGKTNLNCAATTATCSSSAILVTSGTGAIGTINAYGTVYPNSTGIVTALNAHGLVDFTRDRTTRTVTTLTLYPGCTVIIPPQVTITNLVMAAPADSDPRPIVLRPVA